MPGLFSTPQRIFMVVGIILISLNLRPAIGSIAPLADRMNAAGLSLGLIGYLTSVPLMLFGIAGLFAGIFGNRIGFARALGVGMLFITIGCMIRPLSHSAFTLILGSVFIGTGIALGNVLLPGLVKRHYPEQIGAMTGIYSTAIGIGSAIGVGVAVDLADVLPGEWQGGLGFWAIPAVIAFLFWIPVMRPTPEKRESIPLLQSLSRLSREPTAWHIALHMGGLSMLFFSTILWLPSILLARGMDESTAGYLVGILQVIGCTASFVIPRYASKRTSQSYIIVACNLTIVSSILAIWYLPLNWVTPSAIFLGFGLAGSFGMSLLVISLRCANARTTAQLSSGVQAFGYLISAPGPWLVGVFKAKTDTWDLSIWTLVCYGLVTACFGYLAGRNKTVSL